ncbi:MAG: class I SAM-dependent methyltransferase [bacterium]
MDYEQNLNELNFKPEDYYALSRPEMLKYIPKDSKRILDVGCGQGVFGKLLREKFGSEVWGIEMDNTSATIAKDNLDNVLAGDVMQIIESMDNKFDCIVFNDILEHLADPYILLQKVKKLLLPNGVVVCSLPNVRYIGNLKRLLIDKQWRYEDAGILDKTHLRFFTMNSIIDTFEALDYELIKIEGINPVKSALFSLLNILSLGSLSDTRYIQFACVAKPKLNMRKT